MGRRKRIRRKREKKLIVAYRDLVSQFHQDVEYDEFGNRPTLSFGCSVRERIGEIGLIGEDFVYGMIINQRQMGADRQFEFEPSNSKNKKESLILMKKEYINFIEVDYGVLNNSINKNTVFGRILLRTNFGREISGGKNKGVTIIKQYQKRGIINITMASSSRTILRYLQFSIEPETVKSSDFDDLSDRVHFLSIFEIMKRSEIKIGSCTPLLDIPSLFL